MATNDVYSVIFDMTYLANQMQNQFTYKANNTTTLASALAVNIHITLWSAMQNVLSDQQVLNNITVKNLNNPTDFIIYSPTSTETGANAGEPLPSYDAIRFYSPTKNYTIRQGSKRFGVTTNAFQNGSYVDVGGGNPALYAGIVAAMNSNIGAGSGGVTCSPIVIKRIKTTSSSGKPVYTIPAVALTTNHYVADNWKLDPLLSSQTTRRLGRGS